MKRNLILGIIIAILPLSFLAKSQDSLSSDPSTSIPDLLYINHFDLTFNGSGVSDSNTILLKESDFIQKFGSPIATSTDYSEELETNFTHHIYNGAEVWYMNNILQAFIIKSPYYSCQLYNGANVRVGDNISVVANLFPGSWATRQFSNQVFVTLVNQSGPVDMSLLFEFDPSSGLITSISVQE